MKQELKLTILAGMGFFLFLSSFIDKNVEYKIKGEIHGLKSDSVIFFIRNYDENAHALKPDTVIMVGKDDKFSAIGKVPVSQLVWVIIGGFKSRNNFSFFLENGTINIKGSRDSAEYISVTGTPSNDDYTAHKINEARIYDAIKVAQVQLKNEGQKSESVSRQAYSRINALFDSLNNVRISMIKTHPHSVASAVYLNILQDNVNVDLVEALYNNLDETVKNSEFGLKIKKRTEGRKRSTTGNMAPQFSAMDTSGKNISLSSFRGKYVLLDFWASWCVPCRKENPYLVEAYARYKDKGFTIVSISMDNIKESWKTAIEKDRLTWTHLSELNGLESRVARLYGVQPIPDNFLIDPDGKLIARGLHGKEVENKLAELIK